MSTPSAARWARAVASAATRSSSVVMYMIASWMRTASKVRLRRMSRMSPCRCSALGTRRRLTASMSGDSSTRVMRAYFAKCDAVFPPPEPSSNMVAGVRPSASRNALMMSSASPAYSSGCDTSGHHAARSLYSRGGAALMFFPPLQNTARTNEKNSSRRLGGLRELDQAAQDQRGALEALLRRGPILEEHDLHIRAHPRSRPLVANERDQPVRIGEGVVAET